MIVCEPLSNLIASTIFSSVSLSSALVASSKTKIGGLLYKALAIPIRCFCPPDKRTPLSPNKVSNPFGRVLINSSSKFALFIASFKSFGLISSSLRPKPILFLNVLSVIKISCWT